MIGNICATVSFYLLVVMGTVFGIFGLVGVYEFSLGNAELDLVLGLGSLLISGGAYGIASLVDLRRG